MSMRYLLITHIPFARQPDGSVQVDRLWAQDLRGLAGAMGQVTVAAPEILNPAEMLGWGAGFIALTAAEGINFVGLPIRKSRLDLLHLFRLRVPLRKAVDQADLVHTSNLFEPNTGLYFAHDYAVRQGKKTLFVVAEDFYDMLEWEWVRTAPGAFDRWRRTRTLHRLNQAVRERVRTASLTFLHTPAAVARYRSFAANAIAIRQPVHERADVLSAQALEARLTRASAGAPLRLITASRMRPLKGLDLLLRAVAILAQRGISVQLKLCGEGPQQAELQALATRLNLTGCVHFPGSLANGPVLREALAQADLFLMPHLTSDFGRAFFDAMAAACPVIAFRSIASQDTVRDGIDGLLTPNADPEALASAIERFHDDRPLLRRTSEAARHRALDNTKSFWNEYRANMIRELFNS